MKTWTTTLLLTLIFCAAPNIRAQESVTAQPPGNEEQQEDKETKEKKAFTLLEQVVDEAQLLRLPENRIRIQISAADLLWETAQGRARSLFSLAAEGLTELLRSAGTEERRGQGSRRSVALLRRDLILAAARHDAPLAYQLLAATNVVAPSTNDRSRSAEAQDNLEQALLSQISALDPKVALQNAEQMLEKGKLPRSLADVLAQLQMKDKDGAVRLEDKMLRALRSANMLVNAEASDLAVSLLQPGVRVDGPNAGSDVNTNQVPLLGQSAYQDLLGTVIDAALKATPQAISNPRGTNNSRRGPGGGGGGGRQTTTPSLSTEAQVEQNNARRLVRGLQSLLPRIDQYLPLRAQAVRQKLAELGTDARRRGGAGQLFAMMEQGNADSLLAAAPTVSPDMQPRVYEQAALKALAEGNADRARQIANDHLASPNRDRVLQQVEFRQISEKAEASKLEELRQTLASLRSDEERIDLLLKISATAAQNNPKLALELLEDARRYTARRATSYQQFELQLQVAQAFRPLAPSRSFETLEPGIMQINELLSAAGTLSGFEVNVFRDGELPLQGGSKLNEMVTRYGQEIGILAKTDFDRAQTLANRFQFTEARILTRLAIVQGMLGREPAKIQPNRFGMRGFGQNTFQP